jgi:hypothetical protein
MNNDDKKASSPAAGMPVNPIGSQDQPTQPIATQPEPPDTSVQTFSSLSNAISQNNASPQVTQPDTMQSTPTASADALYTPIDPTTPKSPFSSPDIPPQTSPAPAAQPPGTSAPFGSQPDSPPIQPVGNMSANELMSTTPAKPKGSKFKLLIILLIIVAFIVYAGVAYLFFSNKQMEGTETESPIANTLPTPTLSLASPTPAQAAKNISIVSGSIIETTASGEKITLIDKDDYPDSGIGGFYEVNQTKDGTKMCFYSIPPALGPMLYYSVTDGTGVTEVAERVRSCVWSTAGDAIAYTNDADTSEPVNIFSYSLASEESTNLTNATASSVIRRYEITSWSTDDAKIFCNYEEIDLNDTTKETAGNCEVNVATRTVTDL